MDLKRQASAPLYEALRGLEKQELFRSMFRGIREEEVIRSWLTCLARGASG